MLVDHTQLQEGAETDAQRFDLCIIGAGACGISLARDFTGSNARVALGWTLSRTEARVWALYALLSPVPG